MNIPLALFGILLGGLFAIFLFAYTFHYWLVGLVFLLLVLFSARRQNWILWLWRVVAGDKRAGGSRWAGVAVNYLAIAAAGFLPTAFLLKLSDLSQGKDATTAAALLLGAGVLVEAFALYFAARRDPMPSIFDIVKNPGRLEAFVSDSSAPVGRAKLEEIDPARLAALIRQDVIGQDRIVADVAGMLARRIRLARRNKPLGVTMFVGATGAGKTELAKSLAKHAFDGKLIRIPCNELESEQSVSRLIGTAAGWTGYGGETLLSTPVQQLGTGVILFDEVEKAHEAVLRVIMTLLDEGQISDAGSNRTLDASQFFIVLTSNAKHEELAELTEKITDPDELRRAVGDTLTGDKFRPEILARIDTIHCFGHLSRRSVVEVVGKFLRGFAEQAGVTLTAVDEGLLIDTLVRHERGAKGVRQLVRLVEGAIVDGMLDRRAEGFKYVAIECQGDAVQVVGVPTPGGLANATREARGAVGA